MSAKDVIEIFKDFENTTIAIHNKYTQQTAEQNKDVSEKDEEGKSPEVMLIKN